MADTATSSMSVWLAGYSSIISHNFLMLEMPVPPPVPLAGVLKTLPAEYLAGYAIRKEEFLDLDQEDARDLLASRKLYEEKGASSFVPFDDYLARKKT